MQREELPFLMVQSRHLVEASGTPERYRVVAFYADWTVHTALDRSAVCCEVLRDVTRTIAENFAPTSPDLTTHVSVIIGFPKLRAELIALFRENSLPTIIFEYYDNWKAFVAFLLRHVADQPISFPSNPKGRLKTIRDEMVALPRPYNIAVEKLAIAHDNNSGAYHWVLELSGDKAGVKIVGAVDLGESRNKFTSPKV